MSEREADIGDFQSLLGLKPKDDPDRPDDGQAPELAAPHDQADDQQQQEEDVVVRLLLGPRAEQKREADRKLVESLHPRPKENE